MPAAAAVPAAPAAPATPPDTELLRTSKARVLQQDYDTELERIPANIRGGFGTDIDRVNALLQQILIDKTLAADARAQGLDKDPDIQHRLEMQTDKLLTAALIERDRAQWAKEFDAKPGIDQAVREQWLTQPAKYSEPPRYKLTIIAFRAPPHTMAEALKLAEDAKARIDGGADMAALARELSDDPDARQTGGATDWMGADRLEPSVVRVLDRLSKPGEVTRPVRVTGGVQLVRLDAKEDGARIPYERAKADIQKQMRDAYVEAKLGEMLNAIRKDPNVIVNQPAVDKLAVRATPDEVKRAMRDAMRERRAQQGTPDAKPDNPASGSASPNAAK